MCDIKDLERMKNIKDLYETCILAGYWIYNQKRNCLIKANWYSLDFCLKKNIFN